MSIKTMLHLASAVGCPSQWQDCQSFIGLQYFNKTVLSGCPWSAPVGCTLLSSLLMNRPVTWMWQAVSQTTKVIGGNLATKKAGGHCKASQNLTVCYSLFLLMHFFQYLSFRKEEEMMQYRLKYFIYNLTIQF